MTSINAKLTLYSNSELVEKIKTGLGNSNNPEFQKLLKPAHWYKVLHFTSYLYLKPIIDNRYKERTDYISINSKMLLKMYTSKFYSKILDALESIAVLEINHLYSNGKFPKSYRLNPIYTSIRFQKETIPSSSPVYSKQMIYRRNALNRSIYGKTTLNHQVYIKVEEQLHRLTIDESAAKQYLLDSTKNQLDNPTSIKRKKYDLFIGLDENTRQNILNDYQNQINDLLGYSYQYNKKHTINRLKRLIDTYLSKLISIDMIVDKNFFFEPDKNGRLHHNFTSLAKDLRQFVLMEGEHTMEGVDIANSQPYLLSVILQDRMKDEWSDELEEYCEFTREGNFYEDLMEITGNKNRDAFKKNVFTLLFSEIEDMKGATCDALANNFPTVFNFLVEMKEEHGYKSVANLLQKTESNLMFKCMLNCFKAGIKVLPIHDSLYSSEANKYRVKQIMIDTFIKELGNFPKFDFTSKDKK
jgi:hypothetical protein